MFSDRQTPKAHGEHTHSATATTAVHGYERELSEIQQLAKTKRSHSKLQHALIILLCGRHLSAVIFLCVHRCGF